MSPSNTHTYLNIPPSLYIHTYLYIPPINHPHNLHLPNTCIPIPHTKKTNQYHNTTNPTQHPNIHTYNSMYIYTSINNLHNPTKPISTKLNYKHIYSNTTITIKLQPLPPQHDQTHLHFPTTTLLNLYSYKTNKHITPYQSILLQESNPD